MVLYADDCVIGDISGQPILEVTPNQRRQAEDSLVEALQVEGILNSPAFAHFGRQQDPTVRERGRREDAERVERRILDSAWYANLGVVPEPFTPDEEAFIYRNVPRDAPDELTWIDRGGNRRTDCKGICRVSPEETTARAEESSVVALPSSEVNRAPEEPSAQGSRLPWRQTPRRARTGTPMRRTIGQRPAGPIGKPSGGCSQERPPLGRRRVLSWRPPTPW